MGVRLHTHLSETAEYVRYCREVHDMTPVEFCAEHGWLGEDVWFAHMVHVDDSEIPLLQQTGTGIAHCPQSNCRLGSGIARVPEMAKRGIPISLAVDGAASNEAADMVQEAHTAWMIHRALGGADAVTVEDVVHWGTRGGAEVLGLTGLGLIEPGKAADLVVYDLDQPRYFGVHDPAVAPVVAGGSATIRYLLINGRVCVQDGVVPGLDMEGLRARAAETVAALA
ncbi:amidohydrolase family protein [Alkalilimnicola ehrlichii]|nr:amidohydrolase family protein [Alkalilimnicola ehrlichii]